MLNRRTKELPKGEPKNEQKKERWRKVNAAFGKDCTPKLEEEAKIQLLLCWLVPCHDQVRDILSSPHERAVAAKGLEHELVSLRPITEPLNLFQQFGMSWPQLAQRLAVLLELRNFPLQRISLELALHELHIEPLVRVAKLSQSLSKVLFVGRRMPVLLLYGDILHLERLVVRCFDLIGPVSFRSAAAWDQTAAEQGRTDQGIPSRAEAGIVISSPCNPQ